jgi:hypothetical protein
VFLTLLVVALVFFNHTVLWAILFKQEDITDYGAGVSGVSDLSGDWFLIFFIA